jgi:hypothetical protein
VDSAEGETGVTQSIAPSYAVLVGSATLFICSFYFGGLARKLLSPDIMSEEVVSSLRFIALPMMFATMVILAMLLNATRQVYDARINVVSAIAGNIVKADRLYTYMGRPADPAHEAFREYANYFLDAENRNKAIFEMYDRRRVENFMKLTQEMQPPKNDSGAFARTKEYLLETLSDITDLRFKAGTSTTEVISKPTLFLVLAWIWVLYATMGAISPPNPFVTWFSTASILCVASILFLAAEYQHPEAGVIVAPQTALDLAAREIGGN